MKIGLFTDTYLPARIDGIVYSVETFRQQLELLGHEVYIFAPRPSLRYHENSPRVIRFPALKGLFIDDYFTSFYFPPQATRQIEKLNLDIVHFHTPSQIGLLGAYFALRHNLPLVSTYHTDLYEYVKHYPAVLPGTLALIMVAPAITGGGISDYRTTLSSIRPERSVDRWNQKIVERGITMLHNHCDLVITPSGKIHRQLQRWKTRSRLTTLPTGVDEVPYTSEQVQTFRHQYGLVPTDHVILFVGRIGTEKNIALLIKAFVLVAKQDPAAKLVLVGGGDDLGAFQDQAAATPYADRIVFTGFIDRQLIGAAYGAATVFAFASTTDTQGLVLNEAAWAGLPIVIIDPSVTEVVKNNENGYVAKNNARDLSQKILHLLKSGAQRQAMGHRSRELAAQYTASRQAAKLLRLYQETIERHYAITKPHSRT